MWLRFMSTPLATARVFATRPSGFATGITMTEVFESCSISVGSSVNARSRMRCSAISWPAGSLPCCVAISMMLRPAAMSSSLGAVG